MMSERFEVACVNVVVETDRLLVREWTTVDAEAAFAVYGDPDVSRYLGGTGEPDPDVASRRERLARIVARYPEWNGLGFWAVVEKAGGEVIGGAELVPLEGGPEVEVGYHLRRDRWGRGYATEVTKALIAYGFERVGLDRIVAVAYPENVASHRVLLKAGLTHLGRRRAFGHDLESFAIERPAGAESGG